MTQVEYVDHMDSDLTVVNAARVRREDPADERGDQETDNQKTQVAAPSRGRLNSRRNRTKASDTKTPLHSENSDDVQISSFAAFNSSDRSMAEQRVLKRPHLVRRALANS